MIDFLPSEIVKSISDVKTGKTTELSEEAKAIVGDNMDKVVLVDVSWGNAKASSYFQEDMFQELFMSIVIVMKDHVYMFQRKEPTMQKSGD